MTRARGAERVGLVWMLIVSTIAALVVVFGFWAVESRQSANSGARGGGERIIRADAAAFHTPAPPPTAAQPSGPEAR